MGICEKLARLFCWELGIYVGVGSGWLTNKGVGLLLSMVGVGVGAGSEGSTVEVKEDVIGVMGVPVASGFRIQLNQWGMLMGICHF